MFGMVLAAVPAVSKAASAGVGAAACCCVWAQAQATGERLNKGRRASRQRRPKNLGALYSRPNLRKADTITMVSCCMCEKVARQAAPFKIVSIVKFVLVLCGHEIGAA